MNLVINCPKDKNMLEDGIAYIRAILMQKYIDDLKLERKDKELIKIELKKELRKDLNINAYRVRMTQKNGGTVN